MTKRAVLAAAFLLKICTNMATATGLFYVEIHPGAVESWGELALPEAKGAAQKLPFAAGEAGFWTSLTERVEGRKTTSPGKNDVLVFIHGMRGDREPYFSEVLRQMRADYLDNPDCPIGQVVVLKWKPGEKHTYKTISQEAAPALAEPFSGVFKSLFLLEETTLGPAGGRLHLLGNSMAARIFSLVFDGSDVDDFEKPVFSTALFAAPDVESANFPGRPAFQKLPQIAGRSYFFFNQKDNALRYAGWVNGEPMLGRDGPREGTQLPENVEVVEVTGAHNRTFSGRLTQHTYYSYSPEVVAIFQKIWREGR